MSANLSVDRGNQVGESFAFRRMVRRPCGMMVGEGPRPQTAGKVLSTLPGAENPIKTLPLSNGAIRLVGERRGKLVEADRLSTVRVI